MISVVEMALGSNAVAERCNRERMKLAFALFDVEIAHSRFAVLDPGDPDHVRCLGDLQIALEKYWQIDNEVERYLQRGGHTTSLSILPAPSIALNVATESHSATQPSELTIACEAYCRTKDQGILRLRRASFVAGIVGRMIKYLGGKAS